MQPNMRSYNPFNQFGFQPQLAQSFSSLYPTNGQYLPIGFNGAYGAANTGYDTFQRGQQAMFPGFNGFISDASTGSSVFRPPAQTFVLGPNGTIQSAPQYSFAPTAFNPGGFGTPQGFPQFGFPTGFPQQGFPQPGFSPGYFGAPQGIAQRGFPQQGFPTGFPGIGFPGGFSPGFGSAPWAGGFPIAIGNNPTNSSSFFTNPDTGQPYTNDELIGGVPRNFSPFTTSSTDLFDQLLQDPELLAFLSQQGGVGTPATSPAPSTSPSPNSSPSPATTPAPAISNINVTRVSTSLTGIADLLAFVQRTNPFAPISNPNTQQKLDIKILRNEAAKTYTGDFGSYFNPITLNGKSMEISEATTVIANDNGNATFKGRRQIIPAGTNTSERVVTTNIDFTSDTVTYNATSFPYIPGQPWTDDITVNAKLPRLEGIFADPNNVTAPSWLLVNAVTTDGDKTIYDVAINESVDRSGAIAKVIVAPNKEVYVDYTLNNATPPTTISINTLGSIVVEHRLKTGGDKSYDFGPMQMFTNAKLKDLDDLYNNRTTSNSSTTPTPTPSNTPSSGGFSTL